MTNLERLRAISDSLLPPVTDIARLVVELLADGIVIINVYGQIIYMSEWALQMFGYADCPSEIIAHDIEELVPAEIKEEHIELRNEFLKNITGEAAFKRITSRPVQGRRKDGTLFLATVGLASMTWNGEPAAVAVIKKEPVPPTWNSQADGDVGYTPDRGNHES